MSFVGCAKSVVLDHARCDLDGGTMRVALAPSAWHLQYLKIYFSASSERIKFALIVGVLAARVRTENPFALKRQPPGPSPDGEKGLGRGPALTGAHPADAPGRTAGRRPQRRDPRPRGVPSACTGYQSRFKSAGTFSICQRLVSCDSRRARGPPSEWHLIPSDTAGRGLPLTYSNVAATAQARPARS